MKERKDHHQTPHQKLFENWQYLRPWQRKALILRAYVAILKNDIRQNALLYYGGVYSIFIFAINARIILQVTPPSTAAFLASVAATFIMVASTFYILAAFRPIFISLFQGQENAHWL